jgi:N-acetylglutamate synthase-like GNAT family acetyltransferase
MPDQVIVGPLAERDLGAAELIVRRAFGTFLGAPDPDTFWSDLDYVHGRFRSPHVAAFGATLDGDFVGSNFATRWGSVGFFGPITIRTDLWDRGIAQHLLRTTVAQFDAWQLPHTGLFTFAQSARHVGLYEKFGFHARYLTAIMVAPARRASDGWQRFSALTGEQQAEALRACRALTDSIFDGLDLGAEIEAVHDLGLGDTVLIAGDGGVAGFAICHYGPASEAGADTCLVKFGAARSGPEFGRLVDACEALAVQAGMANLMAGANLARTEAYRHLKGRGFRTAIQGIAMHRPNEPGYSRPGAWVIDDWR